MQPTNVDRALAALEEQYADDPDRASMLRLSRRFKSSWLELGEALTEVKRGKEWERWGYDSFDTYTKNELKLRPDTVEKLTGSYMFLHKRAPEVLRRDPLEALPTMKAIDYLRKVEQAAEEDDSLPKEAIADVRKQLLDDGVSVGKVAKLYNETLFPQSDHDKREASKKEIKRTATKLRDLLAESNAIPKALSSTVGEALDELLTTLSEKKKAA